MGIVGRMVHVTCVWSFGKSNGSAVFSLWLIPELLFLDVTSQPPGAFIDESEVLKKEESKGKDY